jgi:hypothetical protein
LTRFDDHDSRPTPPASMENRAPVGK